MNCPKIPLEYKPLLFTPTGVGYQLPPPDTELRPILPKSAISRGGGSGGKKKANANSGSARDWRQKKKRPQVDT